MIVIGFDPGYTTGVAEFYCDNKLAFPTGQYQWKYPDLLSELDNLGDHLVATDKIIVVIEDFKLLPHKAQRLAGTGFEQTIEAIGAIKSFAHQHKAEVVMQSPRIKPIAQQWTQVKPVGAHKNSHWVDAYNHAKYYMIKNNLDMSELEKEQAKK